MKIKLSRSKWEEMGRKAQWLSDGAEEANPTPFHNCMLDVSGATDPQAFAAELRDLCVKYNVKLDIFNKTIDV